MGTNFRMVNFHSVWSGLNFLLLTRHMQKQLINRMQLAQPVSNEEATSGPTTYFVNP